MADATYSYKEKSIKNINSSDNFVAISGTIVDKGDNSFVLDDGRTVAVYSENIPFNVGDYVRVFGRLIVFEKGVEIHSDFIQDLRNIDRQLHQRVIMLLE